MTMSDKWKKQDKYEAVSKQGTGGQSKWNIIMIMNIYLSVENQQ